MMPSEFGIAQLFVNRVLLLSTLLAGVVSGVLSAQEENASPAAANQIPAGEGSLTGPAAPGAIEGAKQNILINFNNVNVVELIRFISRISNTNFIFDENDLQFTVTIVSEEPSSIENMMAALLQELRIHGLTMFEQGNTIVIHKMPNVSAISRIVAENLPGTEGELKESAVVTRLFRLNSADANKIATILTPLVSSTAIVEVFADTNHLIVTDLVTNVNQIALLVKSLDAPNNGLVVGQYVVHNAFIDALVQLAERIMAPIAKDQTLIFVPHKSVNSIFIVSTPFLVERTMAVLQRLDQTQGVSGIFSLNDLKYNPERYGAGRPGAPGLGAPGGPGIPGAPGEGRWELDNNGNWVFRSPGLENEAHPPQGYWTLDSQGNWVFHPGAPPPGLAGVSAGPEGHWVLDPQGYWVYQLAPGAAISPTALGRTLRATSELPIGNIERTQFYIYKLNYRRGDTVTAALGQIGISLGQTGTNADLVATINSVQWLDSSNALIFTGTSESLDKVRELVLEIDTPVKQVFIEMLLLEATITDTLDYGVDWGTQFGGGNTAGAQSFQSAGSPFPVAFHTAANLGSFPDASNLITNAGFSQGIIGRSLRFGGLTFSSLGALVRAVHDLTRDTVIANPKILTEDNFTAEVFSGINTQFPLQAVVNNLGQIITQNFEFRDVGTRLRVTPQIADNDMITLLIEEERSNVITVNFNSPQSGPTTRRNTTRTKVHMPDGYFLIISGIMEDENIFHTNRVPCLGGIPLIGGFFKEQDDTDDKHNLLLFIRPKIVNTEDEIQNITKHQQDVWWIKNTMKKSWKYEVDMALEYFNLPPCGGECGECDCDYTGDCN